MGAEPSSPCAQLEHLADLLRNRVDSQWNPSLYEIWRPKIAEDIEKQWGDCAGTVRSLGSAQGPRLLWTLAQHLWQDTRKRVRSPAPSPIRAGRAAWHQEGPGCWKLLGGIEMKWETHRSDNLLGLWMQALEKLRCQNCWQLLCKELCSSSWLTDLPWGWFQLPMPRGWVAQWNCTPRLTHAVSSWVTWFEPGSLQRTWAEVGTLNSATQTRSPSSQNHRKGEKAQPHSSMASRKTSRTHWTGLESVGGLFFFLLLSLLFSFFFFPQVKQ